MFSTAIFYSQKIQNYKLDTDVIDQEYNYEWAVAKIAASIILRRVRKHGIILMA